MVRRWFYVVLIVTLTLVGLITMYWPPFIYSMILVGPIALLGLYDSFQRKHTILRNFPNLEFPPPGELQGS